MYFSFLPSQVTSAKATVQNLAQNLRDGVLLCLLLNKLSPGAVDKNDISQRPQMSQFLCLKNIRTFLQVRENLKISSYLAGSIAPFHRVLLLLHSLHPLVLPDVREPLRAETRQPLQPLPIIRIDWLRQSHLDFVQTLKVSSVAEGHRAGISAGQLPVRREIRRRRDLHALGTLCQRELYRR